MRNATPLPEIEWVPGEKISRPGIYRNLPMEIYHGDCCVGPSISSGGLRTIESESLLHFWDTYFGNPDAAKRTDNAAYTFGRAVHTLFAKEAGFWDSYIVRPDEAPDGRAWHAANLSCKGWEAQQEKDKKSVLTKPQLEQIRGMARQLGKHPIIKEQGLLNGPVERSIIFPVEVPTPRGSVIIWVKTRPDALPEAHPTIADYKTCEEASAISTRRAITDYGYHQQLALISWALYAVAKRKTSEHVLCFQEKKRPFAVNIKPIASSDIEFGHRQNWRALLKFADALQTGNWFGYEDDTHTAHLMPYLADRLVEEAKSQELPLFDPYKVGAAKLPALLSADDGEAI